MYTQKMHIHTSFFVQQFVVDCQKINLISLYKLAGDAQRTGHEEPVFCVHWQMCDAEMHSLLCLRQLHLLTLGAWYRIRTYLKIVLRSIHVT